MIVLLLLVLARAQDVWVIDSSGREVHLIKDNQTVISNFFIPAEQEEVLIMSNEDFHPTFVSDSPNLIVESKLDGSGMHTLRLFCKEPIPGLQFIQSNFFGLNITLKKSCSELTKNDEILKVMSSLVVKMNETILFSNGQVLQPTVDIGADQDTLILTMHAMDYTVRVIA